MCEVAAMGTQIGYTLGYRPRGALARALHNKIITDHCLETMDRKQWYEVDRRQLKPEVCDLFVQMEPDDETETFLDESYEISNSIFTQIYHSFVKFFLGFFLTQTSINGLLGRGSMFVFSSKQFEALIGRRLGESGHLIDLGAGDGAITQIMASYFTEVSATEVSTPMKRVLAARGFRILEPDDWMKCGDFDTVTCLNVLDRCDKPLSLLRDIKSALVHDRKAVLAIVLPFKAYVESGSWDHKPSEILPIHGETFEAQVNSLIFDILIPEGFQVESWTRLPYLCQGDLNQSYYWLDDAVLVLSLPSSVPNDK